MQGQYVLNTNTTTHYVLIASRSLQSRPLEGFTLFHPILCVPFPPFPHPFRPFLLPRAVLASPTTAHLGKHPGVGQLNRSSTTT